MFPFKPGKNTAPGLWRRVEKEIGNDMRKYNEKVSVKALADLRESVGWNRLESECGSPVMTSYFHIAVYENHKMVGYVDCVSNGVTDAYIQDLMVHSAYQGRGIGTELMKSYRG